MSVFSCAALTLPLDPNLATHASQREDGLQWDSPPASQALMDTSAPGCHLPQLRMVCSPRPHPFATAVKQPASMFSFLHIESLSRQGWEFFLFFLNDISLVGKNLWWLLHLNGNLSRPTETWLPPGEHPERKWERLWIGVSRWKGLCTVCAATLCLQMQITGGEAHKPFYILLLKNLFSYTLPFSSAPASPRCHR